MVIRSILFFLIGLTACTQLRHLDNNELPSAQWIYYPNETSGEFGVYIFRKNFSLKEIPESFPVKITADSRYRLYVNEQEVNSGPAKSDLNHWMYDSLDLVSFLKEDGNLLAIEVVHFDSVQKPICLISDKMGLWVQGATLQSSIINSDSSYKVFKNEAVKPLNLQWWEWAHGWYAIGPTDEVDGTIYPWGWEKSDFEDAHWLQAKTFDEDEIPWHLVPRNIPLLTNKLERLKSIRQINGISTAGDFIAEGKKGLIPAHKKVSVILDNGHLTSGFPEMVMSGGKGSKVKITYAESPFTKEGVKSNRNVLTDKEIIGCYDVFYTDGGKNRIFKPHWWRTFRYLKLDIQTADEPLILEDYYNKFVTYPFKLNASFTSDDTTLHPVWNVAWRTARLCAFDTYMDCPYYEQLNYIGDTRIQMYISLFASGDDRLMRNAIEHFYHSFRPEHLTQACFPSDTSLANIIIPTYSLYFISILHDYWMHRQDDDFVLSKLGIGDEIIDWFLSHVDETGLVKDPAYWNFVDWSFPANGVPPGAIEGQGGYSAFLTLQLIKTMQEYIEMLNYFSSKDEAGKISQRIEKLKNAVMEACYLPEKGLLADTPDKNSFSQHTNIYGILTNTIPENAQKELMMKILEGSNMVKASLYFKFYLFSALKKTGMGEEFFNELKIWQEMLDAGLTTFSETERITTVRSDCHAWSASPLYEYLHIIAGVESAGPGFQTIKISPNMGHLNEIRVNIPHPKGTIRLELEKDNNHLSGHIELPLGITGTFSWNNKIIRLNDGMQNIKL